MKPFIKQFISYTGAWLLLVVQPVGTLSAQGTADDYRRAYALRKEFSNKVYYGDVFRLDTQEKYDGEFSAYKLAITNICHQAIFYPVSVFIKHRYNLKYKIMADHILNMQCFGDKYQFTYFPFTIAIYEGDGYSANNIDQEYMKDKLHLVKENFPNSIYNYAVLRRKLSKLKKH